MQIFSEFNYEYSYYQLHETKMLADIKMITERGESTG